jgi:hypothetical protein
MTEQQSTYEGWAILEIFGHQKYAGFVKTEYFGTACMFRCDVPPLPEREQVTKGGCYVETDVDSRSWVPPGSKVKKVATIGYTKLFGVGAIYSMTPCDEQAALRAVEEIQPRSLMLVSLPAGKALAAGADPESPDEAMSAEDDTDDSDMCLDCGKPIDNCRCP